MSKSSTSFGQPGGNPANRGGRPKGLARILRDEIEQFTKRMPTSLDVDPTSDGKIPEETVRGFRALARRLWTIAMVGEDKDSLVAIKIIYERTDGAPRAVVALETEQPGARIDWSAVPVEKREQLLQAHREMRELAQVVEVDDDSATEH